MIQPPIIPLISRSRLTLRSRISPLVVPVWFAVVRFTLQASVHDMRFFSELQRLLLTDFGYTHPALFGVTLSLFQEYAFPIKAADAQK